MHRACTTCGGVVLMTALVTGGKAIGAQPAPRATDRAAPCQPAALSTYRSSRGSAYEVTGCGPAVLVLHGFSADRRMWHDLVPSWRRHARLILVDLKSHGESAAATAWDDPVADLLRILQEQQVDMVSVVGHSAGAALAVDLAARAPTRVAALVLLAPSVSGFVTRARVDLSSVAEHVRAGDLAGATAAWLASPLMSTTLPPARAAGFQAMIRANAPVWRAPRGAAPATADTAAVRIEALRMPLLIGLGRLDTSGSAEVAAAIVRAHPKARIHEFDGAGHWLPIERPAAVGDTVLAFLQSAWCRASPPVPGARCAAGSPTTLSISLP